MKTHLVIAAIGKDMPGAVSELSKAISDDGCTISDSRMAVLGSDLAVILMISGPWNGIAKIESALPGLQDRLGMTIITKRTERRATQNNMLPYMVEVVAMDQPGIIYQLADFFARRTINIEDLYTGSYAAAHSGTLMCSLNMTVNVPADIQIAGLREQFADFCDELNLDGVLEPLKR